MSGTQLSRRLILEERTVTSDGAGGSVVEWSATGTLWADVRPQSGREVFAGAQPRERVSYRIVVRSAPHGAPSRPRADQRLRDGDRVFKILSVSDRDARFLEILAEEGIEQ